MSDRSEGPHGLGAGPTAEAIDLTDDRAAEAVELRQLAEDTATDAQTYLDAVTEVASGSSPDTAIPVLLLALSQLLLAGARLGAITDVVPSERFEPDAGPDADVDPLRAGLANLLDGLDEYADIVDPLTSRRGRARRAVGRPGRRRRRPRARPAALPRRPGRRGAVVVAVLLPVDLGRAGRRRALRVLQSMLGHLRLDVDAETVADAEFEALHTD